MRKQVQRNILKLERKTILLEIELTKSFFFLLEIEPPREIDEDEQDGGLIFYIENLLPLNVIQQEAWTDIQAINPNYKIKDIKKLHLNSF